MVTDPECRYLTGAFARSSACRLDTHPTLQKRIDAFEAQRRAGCLDRLPARE
jgi:hypothetical protein